MKIRVRMKKAKGKGKGKMKAKVEEIVNNLWIEFEKKPWDSMSDEECNSAVRALFHDTSYGRVPVVKKFPHLFTSGFGYIKHWKRLDECSSPPGYYLTFF